MHKVTDMEHTSRQAALSSGRKHIPLLFGVILSVIARRPPVVLRFGHRNIRIPAQRFAPSATSFSQSCGTWVPTVLICVFQAALVCKSPPSKLNFSPLLAASWLVAASETWARAAAGRKRKGQEESACFRAEAPC